MNHYEAAVKERAMGFGLTDILQALDRWDDWKRMREAPSRVDELEKRLAAAEQKLGAKWPGDVCKACGTQALRLTASMGPTQHGKMREEWTCTECNMVESRLV